MNKVPVKPVKITTKLVSIRMPKDLLEEIRDRAMELGMGYQPYLIQCLRIYLTSLGTPPMERGEELFTVARPLLPREEVPEGPVVYFLRSSDPSGSIKIGFSDYMGQRLASLRSRNGGFALTPILYLSPGDRALEGSLHRAFVGSRSRGEWYHPTAALESYLSERIREAGGVVSPVAPRVRSSDVSSGASSVVSISSSTLPSPGGAPGPDVEGEAARTKSRVVSARPLEGTDVKKDVEGVSSPRVGEHDPVLVVAMSPNVPSLEVADTTPAASLAMKTEGPSGMVLAGAPKRGGVPLMKLVEEARGVGVGERLFVDASSGDEDVLPGRKVMAPPSGASGGDLDLTDILASLK